MAKAKTAVKETDQARAALGGLLGLAVAYAFVTRAFHTGSYWQYALAIASLVFGIRLLLRTFKK